MSAGLPSEVTAFGTCRCVSGQFRQPRSSASHPRKKSRNSALAEPALCFFAFFGIYFKSISEETTDAAFRTSIFYRERACATGIFAGDLQFAGRRICRLFHPCTP